jgi:Flp pilus assembly protein TadD
MQIGTKFALLASAGICVLANFLSVPAIAKVERSSAASGQIISVNGDEQVRFITEPDWRAADAQQDLLTGDALKTGPRGALALRFVDQTMIRMHRNSELTVKALPAGGTAELELSAGRIWARAATGGTGVNIETPSATAAIRGTDWSVDVAPDGKSTLVVTVGTVIFRNDLGSVTVGAGEAAVAAIGQAPSKIVLAVPPGREQMLYHISARSAFTLLPLSDLTAKDMRAAVAAAKAKAPEARATEDWVTLAETGLRLEGREAARQAVAEARKRGDLTPRQTARLALVEAMILGLERHWAEAAAGFLAAAADLDPTRRYSADLGRYVALILDRKGEEANALNARLEAYPETAIKILGQAWLAAIAGDLPEALTQLQAAEPHFPGDSRFPVFIAQVSLLLGKEAEARAAVDRAVAIDPDDTDVLNVQGTIQGDLDWIPDLAIATLKRAVAEAPGNADAWNSLGLAYDGNGDTQQAEDAFKTAIALDPEDPVAPSNYAIVLLDHDKLDEAKVQIDRVEAIDPSYYVNLLAKGRWQIQRGEVAEARETFLDSVAANPAVEESSLGLAISYYQNGETKRAQQTLDAADRLDPNDPLVPLVRTVIALDEAEADQALINARDSFNRYRKRGGVYSPLAASKASGSYLNAAFSELGLNEWSRYYGDLLFNSFDASSHFFQSSVERGPSVFRGVDEGNPEANSSLIQGLLLDPLSIASRNRFTDLFRRPFLDTSTGGSLFLDDDGEAGWSTDGEFQGFSNQVQPFSFYANFGHSDFDADRLQTPNNIENANLFLGTNLTLSDRLLVWGRFSDAFDRTPEALLPDGGKDKNNQTAYETGIGFSHSFAAKNVVNATFVASGADLDASAKRKLLGIFDDDNDAHVYDQTLFFGLAHNLERGPLTLHYGVEGQTTDRDIQTHEELTLQGITLADDQTHTDVDPLTGRAYVDLSAQLGDRVNLEGGLFLTRFDDGADVERTRVQPRVGVAWLPVDGQWLRLGYREDLVAPTAISLAPVTTVGLVSSPTPITAGGTLKSAIARWDAEWSERFFTALEFEHQTLTDFSAGITDSLSTVNVDEGRIERVTASANAWLGGGLGLFGSVTFADSEVTTSGSGEGDRIPLVPDWQSTFGVTWVHPSQISATLSETLVGDRDSAVGGPELDTVALTNFSIAWQPLERHLDLQLQGLNLTDEDVEIVDGFAAPGRTIALSAHVKF